MLVSFVAFAFNTALNFALIPRWGMYGAAYATIVAYVIEALVMYFVAQRLYPNKLRPQPDILVGRLVSYCT